MRIVALIVSLGIACPAFADHGVLNGGNQAASLGHSVQAMSTLARYQVGNESGLWNALVLQGEWAPLTWGSVRASIPTVRISPDGETSAVGVGDASVGLRATVPPRSPQDFRWVLGLYGTLPTGSESKRIGSGHYEVTPVVEMALPMSAGLSLNGMLGSKFSLGGDHNHEEDVPHDHEAGTPLFHAHPISPGGSSLYSPHASKEIEARLSIAGTSEEGFWETGLRGGWGMGDESAMTPVEVDIQGGLQLGTETTLLMGMTHTLSGTVRTPWKVMLGLSWTFDRNSDVGAGGGCQCSIPSESSHQH